MWGHLIEQCQVNHSILTVEGRAPALLANPAFNSQNSAGERLVPGVGPPSQKILGMGKGQPMLPISTSHSMLPVLCSPDVHAVMAFITAEAKSSDSAAYIQTIGS